MPAPNDDKPAVSAVIESLRRRAQMTQETLLVRFNAAAKKMKRPDLELSDQSLISMRESGKKKIISSDEQEVWARAFGLSREEWDERVRLATISPKTAPVHSTRPPTSRIPVYARVPAGPPTEGVDMPTDWIDRDGITGGSNLIAVQVHGDSMAPTFLDGDTVILDPVNGYENHKPVGVGDPVCVRFSEDSDQRGAETLARFYPNEDNTITLRKDNPAYRQIIVPREWIDAMWRVIQRRTSRF